MSVTEILNSVKEPENAYVEAMGKDPMFWVKYLRRHNANIIEALFMDRDYMTEKDIEGIIGQVADFFGLPVPEVKEKAETMVEVMTSEDPSEFELYYNWKAMDKAGINNKDALKLAFVHEMAHQFLFDKRFLLFKTELWVQELAADMLVGGFSVLNGDVATGKYKFVASRQKATLTHPDGELRREVVDFGREQTYKMLREGRYHGVSDLLSELPCFVYSHYEALENAWESIDLEEELAEKREEPRKPIDYEALPDTNLLKQYYLKHRKEIEERKSENGKE